MKELWILGGTGTRIDHVLANIQVLKIPYDAGVEAYIVDVCNKISLIGKETCLKKEDAFGPYFSVFPLGGIVEHFSLEGRTEERFSRNAETDLSLRSRMPSSA